MATKVASRSLHASIAVKNQCMGGCGTLCVTAFCDGCAPPAYRWACSDSEVAADAKRNGHAVLPVDRSVTIHDEHSRLRGTISGF